MSFFALLERTLAKRKWTPEERAVLKAAAEARQRLAASIERYERWLDEEHARQERRRRVINRLSLGLLARR
jgi:hypothetical protein